MVTLGRFVVPPKVAMEVAMGKHKTIDSLYSLAQSRTQLDGEISNKPMWGGGLSRDPRKK